MKRLGRICIFSQSIHDFLLDLKRYHRPLLETIAPELRERYLTKKALGCFSLVKPSAAAKSLAMVGQDLFCLVEHFRGNNEVASLSTFGVLLRVLRDQCEVSATDAPPLTITVKEPSQIASSSLQNPSDPEAGYDGHKVRDTSYS